MKSKKYLVGEGTVIRYSSETGKECKCKTMPTDIDEARRGYGYTENANQVKTNKKEED